MYFEPTLARALQAGQELAQIIIKGELQSNIPDALDKALFVSGTVNAYFTSTNTVQTTTDYGQNTLEELATQVASSDSVTTSSFDLTLLWVLAKRIICSL